MGLRSQGPAEYQEAIDALIGVGEGFGLTFLPIQFQVANQDNLAELASFGLPNRFNHWYFGGVYKNLKIQQEQQVFKILELVLNTDPVYAFLLDTNTRLENLTVIAHVLGHVDFFVNNCWYSRSDKGMLNRCEMHSRAIRELEGVHGKTLVEGIVTAALTLASGISAFEKDPALRLKRPFYFLQEAIATRLPELRPDDPKATPLRIASQVLEFMRREQEYFDLIARTQIMNEGWASFIEFKLLERFLPKEEWLTFSLSFSKRPAPYLIGFTLLNEIFRKQGWPGLLKVRAAYEDVAFIDEFLTAPLAKALDLFVLNRENGEKDFDLKKVKEKIIEEKIWKSAPVVEVERLDPESGHLVLKHQDPERTLDKKRAELFLQELHKLWPWDLTLSDAESDFRFTATGFSREKR